MSPRFEKRTAKSYNNGTFASPPSGSLKTSVRRPAFPRSWCFAKARRFRPGVISTARIATRLATCSPALKLGNDPKRNRKGHRHTPRWGRSLKLEGTRDPDPGYTDTQPAVHIGPRAWDGQGGLGLAPVEGCVAILISHHPRAAADFVIFNSQEDAPFARDDNVRDGGNLILIDHGLLPDGSDPDGLFQSSVAQQERTRCFETSGVFLPGVFDDASGGLDGGYEVEEPLRPSAIGTVKNGLPSWPAPMGITHPMRRFFHEKDASLCAVRWVMNPTGSRACTPSTRATAWSAGISLTGGPKILCASRPYSLFSADCVTGEAQSGTRSKRSPCVIICQARVYWRRFFPSAPPVSLFSTQRARHRG